MFQPIRGNCPQCLTSAMRKSSECWDRSCRSPRTISGSINRTSYTWRTSRM